MVADRKFTNRKKTEKAAALLTLAADKEGAHGRCLLPEEMAALLDSRCEEGERTIFMQHLSGCEKCYLEWFTLKKITDHSRHNGRLYHLSRLKKYSFIGSALAVAASVAVFLNITDLPYSLKDQLLEKEAQTQPEKKSAAPPMRSKTEESDVPAVTEDTHIRQMKGLSVPQTAPELRPAREGPSTEIFGDQSKIMDVDEWLKQLENNCLAENKDMEFWAAMRFQGEKILENQNSLVRENIKDAVSAALILLSQMDTGSITNQCRQLLTVLADDGKSR
ncbi:MAG: hypothetical protein WBB19_09130 [Desulforhopalus sp.]